MQNSLQRRWIHEASAVAALLASGAVQAGRPLTVDDADVEDAGAGHVESWYARQPGKLNTWTVAPAIGLGAGLELDASAMRDTTSNLTTSALHLKWRITPSQEDGCNFGASAGVSHTQNAGNTPDVTGLFTCNGDFGALHLNAGANRPKDGPTLGTWGIALEHTFGAYTAHVETFGQRHSAPTQQIGLRTEFAKNWQIDGTLGRTQGETLYSVGFKFSF
jgi:hypothetical protein